MRGKFSLAALLLALPVASSAQLLVGQGMAGSGVGNLYNVDPATCAVTAIGAMGVSITGLAQAPDGTLYATESTQYNSLSDSRLLQIDPLSGVATPVGTLTDSGGSFVHGAMPDAMFVGSTLYAWTEETDDLTTVNTATGEVTVVGDTGQGSLSAGSGLSTDAGGTSWVIPCSGCGGSGPGAGGALYTVDLGTGVITHVVDLSGDIQGNIDAMSFAADGTLYAIEQVPGSPGDSGSPTRLVSVDTTTGVQTEVCTTAQIPVGLDAIVAASVVPVGPAAIPTANEWMMAGLALLIAGAAGVVVARRRAA